MSDLLELAVAAHGGWDRWQNLKTVIAHVSVGGAIWHLKGWPDVFADAHVSIDPQRQHTEYSPFIEAGRHTVFEPNRTAIVTDRGEVVEQREQPRKVFEGHNLTTPWDAQHLIYFTGYAMWTYMTTPFLFKFPGFKTEEVEPWTEDGETWRRLKVIFPSNIHSHSTEQTFYFDASGILRRHDYSTDVMEGTSSANYLPRLTGRAWALEVILGAEAFAAETAERYGWVNRALPPQDLRSFVMRLVMRIASFLAAALAQAKRAVDAALLAASTTPTLTA